MFLGTLACPLFSCIGTGTCQSLRQWTLNILIPFLIFHFIFIFGDLGLGLT